TTFPGGAGGVEKFIVCEYGVVRWSSIAAVMAKPPAARPEGNTAGKVPKPGAGNSKFGGRVVSPVKRGLVLGVSTPAGFVTDVESPKDRVPESAFVASAPPMRS